MPRISRSLFSLGRTIATPAAVEVLREHRCTPGKLLDRHASGDWGDLGDEDRRANDTALREGLRLFSSYSLGGGDRLWIITEADRSSTCVLTPDCY